MAGLLFPTPGLLMGGVIRQPLTESLVDTNNSDTARSGTVFFEVSVGAVPVGIERRFCVVVIGYRNTGADVSAVTLLGNSLTLGTDYIPDDNGVVYAWGEIPTGTSGTLSISGLSDGQVGASVYRVIATDDIRVIDTDNSDPDSNPSVSLNPSDAGQFAVCYGQHSNDNSIGLSGSFTEDFNFDLFTADRFNGGGLITASGSSLSGNFSSGGGVAQGVVFGY